MAETRFYTTKTLDVLSRGVSQKVENPGVQVILGKVWCKMMRAGLPICRKKARTT